MLRLVIVAVRIVMIVCCCCSLALVLPSLLMVLAVGMMIVEGREDIVPLPSLPVHNISGCILSERNMPSAICPIVGRRMRGWCRLVHPLFALLA